MDESSLSRVRTHIRNVKRGKGSFAFLTAWKSGQSKKANRHAMHKLARHLRKLKVSHTKLRGHGQEDGGRVSKEPSLMVHNISFKQAKRIGKRHRQYSIIYAGPETKGQTVHHKLSGEPREKFGRAKYGKAAKYYSSVKGRPFHFGSRGKQESVKDLIAIHSRWLVA